MNAIKHRLLLPVVVCVLVACGGGGGGGGTTTPPTTTTPPPAVNHQPVAVATIDASATVGVAASMDAGGSSDPDGDRLAYAWTIVAQPAGSTAHLVDGAAQQTSFVPDRVGTYTFQLIVSDGVLTSAPVTVSVVAALPAAPQIALDQVEPVSGNVKMFLAGAVTGTVQWYVDANVYGSPTSDAASQYAVNFNSLLYANGSHLLTAVIKVTPADTIQVQRTVQVSNSPIQMSVNVQGTSGTIVVDVNASSPSGITSVSATLDGTSQGTLTAPTCIGGVGCVYRFLVDGLAVGSGVHAMVITAEDAGGTTKQLSVALQIANVPQVTLTSPQDSTFAYGSLQIAGTATSDIAGTVTTTVWFNNLQIFQTTSSPFSFNYDISSFPAGNYVVKVQAKDSAGHTADAIQRTVSIASSASLAYTPVFQVPGDAVIVAADGNQILYTRPDRSAYIGNLTTGATTTLQGTTSSANFGNWQLSGGRAAAIGAGTDCVTLSCVYLWPTDGSSALNLSSPSPHSSLDSNTPVFKGDYILWAHGTNGLTLYQLSSNSYTSIDPPPGTSQILNIGYDFAATGGIVHVYFSDYTTIHHWRSDTTNSTALTAGNEAHTDGIRVMWLTRDFSSPARNWALYSSPVASDTPALVTSSASAYLPPNGLLAWQETDVSSVNTVKAAIGSQTSAALQIPGAGLAAVGSGDVIYVYNHQLYSWDSVTGVSTLRLDTAITSSVAGGNLIFRAGQNVYGVPLH